MGVRPQFFVESSMLIWLTPFRKGELVLAESDLMCHFLLNTGFDIPADAVLAPEDCSQDTLENAYFSLRLLTLLPQTRSRRAVQLTVITSASHMQRTRAIFTDAAASADCLPGVAMSVHLSFIEGAGDARPQTRGASSI